MEMEARVGTTQETRFFTYPTNPGIRGAQPEKKSQNVPLHSSTEARWQSVSGR